MHFLNSREHIALLPEAINTRTGHSGSCMLTAPWTKQLMWDVKRISTGTESVSPTQHGTNVCGLWTRRILRERERTLLFFEGLPHVLFVLPHLLFHRGSH